MIAFKPQSLNPLKPSGMPDEWPWQESVIEDSEQALFEANGWTCLSADSYILYKANYQSAYDTWYNSQPNQYNRDKEKYLKRASVKDGMVAEMAAGNMSRVRAGTWTVADLISLLQDTTVVAILNDMATLSFELAYAKVDSIASPLATTSVKTEWKTLLATNFYN